MLSEILSWQDWIILSLCALTIGGNKAGLRGINIIVIPIFASYFGGKASSSTVLPLLILGDIFSVIIYRKNIKWSYLKQLLPSTLAGLAGGMLLGQLFSDRSFIYVMSFFILFCLILMVYKEFSSKTLILPDHWAAHSIAGFTGGFSSMVGNAAGPIMSLYLLSMNLPKMVFIGTGAVFFFIVNLLKIPVHLFIWKSMSLETLKISLILSPFILLGLFLGLKLVRIIPEKPFRLFIILGTLLGTVKLFLG
ncbi:sulfite exporter TauE/SafE family protein [Oceanispirochaeta crateris]|uniref:sulfite exporter TauE/SafE family protein n=1 Tax=Oceanispirochaeta crateris TaxID=2518645 RepID=UPI00143D541B|nr:sulfite exporter TauE/SafE family protein [Oceanispirochaeta crateris]